MTKSTIAGLVLCGGQSSRMGRDKAFLSYHGKPQYQWTSDLLAGFCDKVYISASDRIAALIEEDCIVDKWKASGPLAALVSAHHILPGQDIFLSPCDMPYLQREDVSFLYKAFAQNPSFIHCFQQNGFADPLFAIWPKASLVKAAEAYEKGERSPRNLMEGLDYRAHDPLDYYRLSNINE